MISVHWKPLSAVQYMICSCERQRVLNFKHKNVEYLFIFHDFILPVATDDLQD